MSATSHRSLTGSSLASALNARLLIVRTGDTLAGWVATRGRVRWHTASMGVRVILDGAERRGLMRLVALASHGSPRTGVASLANVTVAGSALHM
jgi:hypothetical protein